MTFDVLRVTLFDPGCGWTFKCGVTERILSRRSSRRLLQDIQQVTLWKLRLLNRAMMLNHLRISLISL